jgi:hypothetical protein
MISSTATESSGFDSERNLFKPWPPRLKLGSASSFSLFRASRLSIDNTEPGLTQSDDASDEFESV